MHWQRILNETGILINRRSVRNSVIQGLEVMDDNHGSRSRCPKHMHTVIGHLLPMMRKVKEIADILGIDPELSLVPIAWHDVVIEFTLPADLANPIAMIRRHRGAHEGDQPNGAAGNEAQSRMLMAQDMRQRDFLATEVTSAEYAVDVTYPGVDLGPDFKGSVFEAEPLLAEVRQYVPAVDKLIALLKQSGIDRGPHFFQPHLEQPLKVGEKVDLVGLAMGLLDLGTCGLAAPDTDNFFSEGNGEYRELRVYLPEHRQRLLADAATEERQKVAHDMINWRFSQMGFALWQAIRFGRIMYWLRQSGQLNDNQINRLTKLFGHYEANVQDALSRAVGLREWYKNTPEDFTALMQYMGY